MASVCLVQFGHRETKLANWTEVLYALHLRLPRIIYLEDLLHPLLFSSCHLACLVIGTVLVSYARYALGTLEVLPAIARASAGPLWRSYVERTW